MISSTIRSGKQFAAMHVWQTISGSWIAAASISKDVSYPLNRICTLRRVDRCLIRHFGHPSELDHGAQRPRSASESFRALSSSSPYESSDTHAQPVTNTRRLGKRKVALFVGYKGSDYRGLQKQQQTAPNETIEDELESALFSAGGILPSNMGDLSKLKWSRSSRTDKSVHSLSTVISMKLECDPNSFVSDPENKALVSSINRHLSDSIRVFSVQRVTKSFDARRECTRRTYHYYIPAWFLGIRGDGSDFDTDLFWRFAGALKKFEGFHAFHNYTRRRLYRHETYFKRSRTASTSTRVEDTKDMKEIQEITPNSGRDRTMAAKDLEKVKVHSSLAGNQEQSFQWREIQSNDGHNERDDEGPSPNPSNDAARCWTDENDNDAIEAAPSSSDDMNHDGNDSSQSRLGRLNLEFKAEMEPADPIVRRHFRFVEECSVEHRVHRLVKDGTPCVRVIIRGDSFMLHQIRHMIGAAIAVTLERFPVEAITASMAKPARINLPLAPPCTLVLVEAEFSKFRASWDGKAPKASSCSGDRLQLRAEGQAERQQFADEVLFPAIDDLLLDPCWEIWKDIVQRTWYEEHEMVSWLENVESWFAERSSQRKNA